MKLIPSPRTLALATVCLLLGATAAAQDIVVMDNDQVLIPNGASAGTNMPTTKAPDTQVGLSNSLHLFVWNEASSGTLLIYSAPAITGPDANQFQAALSGTQINPNLGATLNITFSPTSAGVKTATVTLQSNDPDSESTYTFAISGEGFTGSVPDKVDMDITLDPFPKAKTSKKTGLTKVSVKGSVRNYGPLPVTSSLVTLFSSPKFYLDDTATTVGTRLIKPLPAYSPTAALKSKKFSGKFTSPVPSAYVFARVESISPAGDADYSNNEQYVVFSPLQ